MLYTYYYIFKYYSNNIILYIIYNIYVIYDEDDELILQKGWPTKGSFPVGVTVRDSHHRKYPTH